MSNTKKVKDNTRSKKILTAIAREGWWHANKKIARQRDIIFLLFLASVIGNVLQVVL